MAASKGYFSRPNHHSPPPPDSLLELTESDIWNSTPSPSPELRKPATPKIIKKFSSPIRINQTTIRTGIEKFSSLPVNIPDWSKILQNEYRENRKDSEEYDDRYEEEDLIDRIPPHELMARTRMASFSVHEGVGRTLKGRDLSRVRNAIWEKTGFQD